MRKLMFMLAFVLASVCAHAQLVVGGFDVSDQLGQYINVKIWPAPGFKVAFFARLEYGQAITAKEAGGITNPDTGKLIFESEIDILNLLASKGYKVVTSMRYTYVGYDTYELLMERK